MQRPPASPHSGRPPSKRRRAQPGLLRILPIGPELRVEELRALLSEQEDMQLLPPIADPDQALDVLSRTNQVSRIDVVIVEGEFCEEQHYHLLRALSSRLRCLVIAPPMYPSVNSSEKIPKSAIPKVSKGGGFYVSTIQCQSKIPQNVCSLKQCPTFFAYKSPSLLVLSSCSSPSVFREGEELPFAGLAARSWNTPALRFSRRR